MKKTDTEQIRLANRKQIINYLRVHGPIARIDMGQALQLSPATITAITAELQKEGKVVELSVDPEKNTARGRPRVNIDLAPKAQFVLGLKLSINELKVTLGNQKGQITLEQSLDLQTLKLNEEGLLEALASAIRKFIAKLPAQKKPVAIGIAVQGVVNGLSGDILWSPALSLRNINLREPLQQLFNLPVAIANDANALAIAIRHIPAYQHLDNFAVIMLGYGIGMGIIINGDLFLGHYGAAAEFGHVKFNPDGAQCLCGKRGCVEAYVGDYALLRDATALTSQPATNALHPTEESMMALVEQANEGKKEICDLFKRAGKALGYGLSNLMVLMSPEKIILSGPGIRAFEHLKPGIQQGLSESLVTEMLAETIIEDVRWTADLTVLGVLALALEMVD